MLKKFIAVSLIAATAVIPTSGAFAAEDTVERSISNFQISPESVVQVSPKSGDVSIMTSTYAITGDGVRLRASASASGTILGTLYKGDMVNGGSEQVTSGGITWVSVYSYKHGVWGWVASQYLEEIG